MALYLLPTLLSDNTKIETIMPECGLETYRSLNRFIVEDLRSARRFLSQQLHLPVQSFTFIELNEHSTDAIRTELQSFLQEGDCGLLSEAGMPCIADPGAIAVQIAHKLGIRVVPLIGPSSILLSLIASGLSGQNFAFNGYIPIKQPERDKRIRDFEARAIKEAQTQIFIETPYRNQSLLNDFLRVLNNKTQLCIAMDLTGTNEYIRTQSIENWKRTTSPLQKLPTIFLIGSLG